MEISTWQKTVDEWIKKYGVRYFNEVTNMLILTEEVGELSKLMARKYGEQSFKRKEDQTRVDTNIADEIGDIFFVLTCLSNQMGYDLDEIVKANMDKKTKRDNERHFKNEKLNK